MLEPPKNFENTGTSVTILFLQANIVVKKKKKKKSYQNLQKNKLKKNILSHMLTSIKK